MIRKLFSRALPVLLALMLIIGLMPAAVFALGMPAYSGGTGTIEDPWLISSVEDLKTLADTVNSGEAADFDADAAAGGAGVAGNYYGYYFRQTCALDLSEIADWAPIGYSGEYYFAGNYDGGNYPILNMTGTGKNDEYGYATAGLFGWVAFGSVSNVHVKNANLKATGQGNYSYAGGIAGVIYGSSVTNCSVSDSVIESARDRNNNCAGGIIGYSTGGTFDRCAAEGNTIKTMAYGGGFVGEVDDDYGVGTSSFKNCYVANSSVTAFTEEVQGLSFAGEFAGEMTASALTLENCFVFNNIAAIGEGSAPPSLKKTGVFAASLWPSAAAAPINAVNCYYLVNEESPVNTGAAEAKSPDEFADGTVTALFGTVFSDAAGHPVIGTFPADYKKVDEAIAKAEALNKSDYKDFSGVEAAINAVVRGKDITQQDIVDDMALAIENAIDGLEQKPADPGYATGDNSNAEIWFAVMLAAFTALTGTVLCGRKRNTANN
ncbi:MAG: GLUG motif-containing protein [Firmicutes bacterium]|nr:GLUG motif-containing protein [Bacillota bacterium]